MKTFVWLSLILLLAAALPFSCNDDDDDDDSGEADDDDASGGDGLDVLESSRSDCLPDSVTKGETPADGCEVETFRFDWDGDLLQVGHDCSQRSCAFDFQLTATFENNRLEISEANLVTVVPPCEPCPYNVDYTIDPPSGEYRVVILETAPYVGSPETVFDQVLDFPDGIPITYEF
jgi:hypothetical protein